MFTKLSTQFAITTHAEQVSKVWVVVKVWRGVPVTAAVYDNVDAAQIHAELLNAEIDPLEDAVEIFETEINTFCELIAE